MKLFFETAVQMRFFLFTLPLGFLVCFFLDGEFSSILLRLCFDLLVLLLCGICLIMDLLIFEDTSIRIYHLLGLICGAVLYMSGFGRLRNSLRQRFRKRKAGMSSPNDEKEIESTLKG